MDAKHRRSRRVLLTGDFLHSDFAGVRAYLANCEDVEVEEESLLGGPKDSCDVIALCQSRPGQFTQAQVEALHRRSPLASLLAILGSWCEGELRSGRPWHGVERVYWYDAIGRLQWLLAAASPVSVCRTLSPAEHIEHRIVRWPRAISGTTAAIVAQRRCQFESLADVCRMLQIVPRWQRSRLPVVGLEPQLLLLTLDDLQSDKSTEALGEFRSTWPNARRIALLNFPRRDEIAMLLEAGFHNVLGKPLLITDLLGCLDGLFAATDCVVGRPSQAVRTG